MKVKDYSQISLFQLFVLVIIFEIGTAVVMGIGGDAKQDAWIAVFLASLLGIGLIFYYSHIVEISKGKNLFELFEFVFGKWLAKLMTFLYVLYFLYIAGRVLRDFCELLVSTIFVNTPVEFIAITMMLCIIYMLSGGIEVLGRTSEIFFPYLFTFALLLGVAIMLSGEFHGKNLLPILGDGFGGIGRAIFPDLLTFPFGETVTFMMLFPSVKALKKTKKVSMLAVFCSGLILTYVSLVQIATLGDMTKQRSNFPSLTAAREISLLNFIERVDLLIVFIVMYGIMVKVSIFFYGGVKGLEYIFHIPHQKFIFPFGLMVSYLAVEISDNFAEHFEEGLKFVPMYLHVPFQLVIPLVLFPFVFMKVRRKKLGNTKESSAT